MRTFLKSIGGIVIIAILVLVILAFVGWSRVPDIISSHLTKTLRVPVDIGDISISMGGFEVKKLEIGNPAGYYLSRAFSAEQIVINSPLSRYFHHNIEIDEIDVNDIYLGLEFDSPKGTKGNWTTIMNNVQNSQAADQKKGGRTVLIRKLVLTDIKTELIYRDQGKKARRLPTIKRIELHNISSSGGNISDQLMNSALGEMIKQVFIEQNLKDILDQILQPGGNNLVENAIQQFRGFFHSVPKKEEPSLT